jgi:hypothetical protein
MSRLKLKLDQFEGFHQLHILSELKPDEHKILYAGLTKLLKEGKNRIFLIFYSNKELAPEITESFKKLNLLARELAGEIAIIAKDPSLVEHIKKQALDQKIFVFPSVNDAIQFIKNKEPKSQEAELILKLKTELAQRSSGELGKLKKENESLKSENKMLLSRINQMIEERQRGFDSQALLEKIQVLEHQLTELLLNQQTKESASNPRS